MLNPLMFWAADSYLKQREPKVIAPTPITPVPVVEASPVQAAAEPVAATGHTIVVGYGRVGSVIARELAAAGDTALVIEDSEGRANQAVADGFTVVRGNGATPESLAEARLATASRLFVALPNVFEAGQAVEQGRRLNPQLKIVARAHSDEEAAHLAHIGADQVVMGETEIGLGMVDRMRGL
jgi:CPA2 family monovalent cation:H+ antiporter-2